MGLWPVQGTDGSQSDDTARSKMYLLYNKLVVSVGLKPGNIQRNTVPERTIQRSSGEELKDMSEKLSGVMSNRITIKEFDKK